MSFFNFHAVRIEPLPHLTKFHTTAAVLRLDLIHAVVSGNKWFKLKEYIPEAKQTGKNTILTFGGAFSNHIIATAAVSKLAGLKSIGIIRGEKPKQLSHTLQDAISCGMKLFFVSREEYKTKRIPPEAFESGSGENIYVVAEGGYGEPGREGAKDILKMVNPADYSHIVCAVGTGTMLAGLAASSHPGQQAVGISVMKNNFELQNCVENLLPAEKHKQVTLFHHYHFGGYAKHPDDLIRFMNRWYKETGIPSDFVYTAKLFFAVQGLLTQSWFPRGSRLLLIHSGGLQGNRSLPKGTLIF